MVTFLITSGPTTEYIDPVRFISNASSGKMGFELASYAKKAGNNVILISGNQNPPKISGVKTITVVSALDMFKKVKANIVKADIFISAAAVADYRPLRTEKNKIKKSKNTTVLKLVKNPDILKEVSLKNKNKIMVGFCLESKNLFKSALKKLEDKRLDLIVANPVKAINSDYSDAVIISRKFKVPSPLMGEGKGESYSKSYTPHLNPLPQGERKCRFMKIALKNKSKKEIAKRIIDESLRIFKNRKAC